MRVWFLGSLLVLGLASGLSALSLTGVSSNVAPALQRQMGSMVESFVTSACLPGVPEASLTLGAVGCEAYILTSGQLVLLSQAPAAVGPLDAGNGTYWLAVHAHLTTVVSDWTREDGTHYLWRQAASMPALPDSMMLLARVTVADGAITVVQDYRRPASYARAHVYDVTDPLYGAADDNATDCRVAIATAIAAASVRGGTVYFPFRHLGVYYVAGSTGTVEVIVPAATSTFGPAPEAMTYVFYVASATGLRFKGDGVTIRSDFANGGSVFLFNGVRDFVWDGITVQSVTGATGFDEDRLPLVTGMNALAFTATTQDSERLLIQNYRCVYCYAGLYVFGDAGGTYRVRGLTIQNMTQITGVYTLAFHNNGDNVTARGIMGYDTNRGYFIYGVQMHDVQLTILEGGANFTGALLKAYDANTQNIHLQMRMARTTTSSKVHFESQHNVAVQPTAGQVRDVVVDYDEQGFAGGGGIHFAYYQDAVVQATTSRQIFNNITLRGLYENDITTGTVFTGAGRVKLNIEDTYFVSGSPSILNASGFYTQPYRTYIPVLRINGETTGITYTTQAGEFFEIGTMVFGTARIKLSSKGALSGALTLSLPRAISTYITLPFVAHVIAYENWTGLTGTLQCFINTPVAQICTFLQSDATGRAPVDDDNLTDTSEILISFYYPKG